MSHVSMLWGINVSSPILDAASHLALQSHKRDFISCSVPYAKPQASQEAAGLAHSSTWSQKHEEHSSWSKMVLRLEAQQ